MRALAVRRNAREEDMVGRVLCHDVRGQSNDIVFRKGHALRKGDFAALLDAPWTEIHLLELEQGDVGQREAGKRLAESLAHDDLQIAATAHRHLLRTKSKGLLKIDVPLLNRLNAIDGIAVFTIATDEVVQPEQVVAEAQIIPLAISERVLQRAEAIAREGLVRVLPFKTCETILWMHEDRSSNDRLAGTVTAKLRWFGCEVKEVVDLARHAESIASSMQERASSGATLFIVSGSNALDPLDPVFKAMNDIGAKLQRIGLPVHPGTLLWLAEWRGIRIVGLPSCGHGTQMTGFDLVLPKLLAEGGMTNEEIATMGHGGVLNARRRGIGVAEARDESVSSSVVIAPDESGAQGAKRPKENSLGRVHER